MRASIQFFLDGYATTTRFYVNRLANRKHLADRSTFQRLAACNFNEAILFLQTLLAVAFCNVHWNRLSGSEPLIASGSIHTRKSFCNAVRECHVLYRKTIKVESFMIENWFVHQSPFEYKYDYEYRFTEYEYDEGRTALMPLHDFHRFRIAFTG